MNYRAKVNRRLVVAPLAEAGDRTRALYPELGRMVELRRVEALGDAIVPDVAGGCACECAGRLIRRAVASGLRQPVQDHRLRSSRIGQIMPRPGYETQSRFGRGAGKRDAVSGRDQTVGGAVEQ